MGFDEPLGNPFKHYRRLENKATDNTLSKSTAVNRRRTLDIAEFSISLKRDKFKRPHRNGETLLSKPTQSNIVEFIVKGFGSGWFPKMPGTAGSALGLLFVFLVSSFWTHVVLECAALIVASLLSWYFIHLYEVTTGKHDDSQVVIDEIVGIFICFVGLPITLPLLFAGFVVFRFFDILKPFPISWADQSVPGALGTLLDDLLAGVIGCAVLHFVVYMNWI